LRREKQGERAKLSAYVRCAGGRYGPELEGKDCFAFSVRLVGNPQGPHLTGPKLPLPDNSFSIAPEVATA